MTRILSLIFSLLFVSLNLNGEQPKILGVGSPYVDVLLNVSDEFLGKMSGGRNDSFVVDHKTFMRIIIESGVSPSYVTGGSCANTMKGLACLGENCVLLGKAGRDVMADFFTDNVKPLGLITKFIRTNTPTGQVVCLVGPDGQRTMRCFGGAGYEFTEKDLLTEDFAQVRLMHFEGYGLRNGQLAQRAMEFSKQAGAKVSLDLGCKEIATLHKKTILSLIEEYVDILFANEDETLALTGKGPEEGCRQLQQLCDVVVVMVGKEGCWVGHKGKVFRSPAYPAKVVDTTGAGDLFASGFLYGYIHQHPLKKCAKFGNMMGAAVVEVLGAEIPSAKWPAIKSKMR